MRHIPSQGGQIGLLKYHWKNWTSLMLTAYDNMVGSTKIIYNWGSIPPYNHKVLGWDHNSNSQHNTNMLNKIYNNIQ